MSDEPSPAADPPVEASVEFSSLFGEDGLHGGLIEVDPATLILTMSDRNAHVLVASASQYADVSRRIADPAFVSRRDIAGGLTQSSAELVARLQHENDHITRLLSTSYGLLHHHLQFAQAAQFVPLYSGRMATPAVQPTLGNDIFPLLSHDDTRHLKSRLHGMDLVQIMQHIGRSSPWERSAYLFLGAAALSRALSDTIDLNDLPLAMYALVTTPFVEESRFGPTGVALNPGLPPYDTGKASPLLGVPGGGASALAGTALLEFMAVHHELNWHAALAGIPQEGYKLYEQDPYRTISLAWLNAFGPFIDPEQQPQPQDGGLFFDAFRIFPLEAYAAVDLALWIPVSPAGFHSPGSEVHWSDLHPGIRFLRAMSAVQKAVTQEGLSLTPVGVPDANEQFERIQEQISAACGWTNPRELADRWLSIFDQAEAENVDFQGFFYERLASRRMRQTRALLRLRQARPADVVLNNMTLADIAGNRIGPSAWLISPGRLSDLQAHLHTHWAGDDKDYALEMLATFSLGRHLMHPNIPLAHLSYDVAEQVVQRLTEICEAVTGQPRDGMAAAIHRYIRLS